MLTLVVGGARSGKSALAVEIGRRHDGAVVYVATSPASLDDDIAERIARHRAERPGWPTIEEPVDLAGALRRGGDALVIVDCLTLWVSNLHGARRRRRRCRAGVRRCRCSCNDPKRADRRRQQ